MSSRTVLNESYRGLVVSCAIPADIHERDGRRFASVGTTMPIHCATPDQVEKLASTTHHYCDIFTEEVLAPLGELALVRLDENTAEKVFLNRSKRLLLTSSDGRLAQWRCAATFESANHLLAGAPVCAASGELASLVTARRGNHYAVSSFEGEGGYFETSKPWEVKDLAEGKMIYGSKAFDTREELREYVESLPAAGAGGAGAGGARPLLWRGRRPRLVLVAEGGRQLSHHYLSGVLTDDIQYL